MGLEIHLYLFDKSTHQRSQLPLGALNILQSLNIFALIKLVQCFVSKKKCIPVERIQADKCFDPVIQVQTNIDTPINQVKEQMKCFELQSYRRPEKPFNQGQARLQNKNTKKNRKSCLLLLTINLGQISTVHFKVYIQALRYNMCIYRIKIRPFMLIHSLFKGISNFELALRFASSLVIQEGSTSLTNSLYSPPPLQNQLARNIKKKREPSEPVVLQTADIAKCDSPEEMT